MTVPFKQIPANIRVPLFFAEVDNSRANTAASTQRTLIFGQYTTLTGAVANVPVQSQGATDAASMFGPNSVLAAMVAMYRANDAFGELWCMPLADDGSATAATCSLQFTAAATANGTFCLYLGGVKYALPVLTTQTTAQLATAMAALVNADPSCPATATVSTNTVTFTADNKGFIGNGIDIRVNYRGAAGGEATPAGLTYTFTGMSGGATNPSLTSALASLASKTFDFIVLPYNDTTSLNALQTFLNDTTGRWSWQQQIYGHVFSMKSGTTGSLTTFGAARNNQHESVIGIYDSPTPDYLWAAALGGAAAASLRVDPGLPLQTVVLQTVLAPPVQSRFSLSLNNSLLYTGISTFNVGDDGTVSIQNLITTYQTNTFGAADNSYLEVETMFLLMFVLRYMQSAVTSKFARVKLAANSSAAAANGSVVTPNVIRAELVAEYRQLEANGYVQNGDAFKAGLIVEQDSTNPNRVNVLWPGILINQLRIFALLAQFRLQ